MRVPVEDAYGPTGSFSVTVGVLLPHIERLLGVDLAETDVATLEPDRCTAYKRFGPAHFGGALSSWRVGTTKIADVSDDVVAVWAGAVDPWLATLGDDQALHRSLDAGAVVLRDPLAPVAVALLVGDKAAAVARISRVPLGGGGRTAERAQRLAAEHGLTPAQATVAAQQQGAAPDDKDDFVTAVPPNVPWTVSARPDRVAEPTGATIIVDPGLADVEQAPAAGAGAALDDATSPLILPQSSDVASRPLDVASAPIDQPTPIEGSAALPDEPTPSTVFADAAQLAPADEPPPAAASPPIVSEEVPAIDEATPVAEDATPFADAELVEANAPNDADERAVVVAWDPPWDEGTPPPHVITAGRRTILLYYAKHQHTEPPPIVLAEFTSVMSQKLGMPASAARGLGANAAHKVERSSWIAELQQAGDDRDAPEQTQMNHYVLTFNDDIFECLAQAHSVDVLHTSMAEALAIACKRLFA
ncbi:MAG: hypothetical protein HYS27_17920 [Deltaproteobacteria bacterium]|nr:hypothetical protein [Deltaproteobacteria bacterium]